MRALVVANLAARRGEASRRYARVRDVALADLEPTLVTLDAGGAWKEALTDSLLGGVRTIVAAGGDGTVHAVTNALVESAARVPLDEICLGAVGLGSSNDFHKPTRRVVRGVPLRMDFNDRSPRDVGRATWVDEAGIEQSRCFLVSASLGATAAANRRFSDPTPVARALGAHAVGAAIGWAAARTLAAHENIDATLTIGDETERIALSNLSVMKTPYLSGTFRYDTPIAPASGTLAINLCHRMSRFGLLRTLVAMMFGRFRGLPRTRTWQAPCATVTLSEPADLELDGELFSAQRVRFDVLRERLMVCA